MEKSKIYLIIGVIVIICALALRLFTPRNRWVCEQGEWRPQGHPVTAQPQSICRDNLSVDAEVKELYALLNEPARPVASVTPKILASSSPVLQATNTDSVKAVVEAELISPQPGELVSSPYHLTGRAFGSWFFEGSLPIVLKTASGQALVETVAKAQDDWMTNGWVRFNADLIFEAGTATSGEIIIRKDNPSGLSENKAQVSYPVRLAPK